MHQPFANLEIKALEKMYLREIEVLKLKMLRGAFWKDIVKQENKTIELALAIGQPRRHQAHAGLLAPEIILGDEHGQGVVVAVDRVTGRFIDAAGQQQGEQEQKRAHGILGLAMLSCITARV